MNYKKYRIFINTPAGGFYAATSNTVNNLVDLVKYWLTRTSEGMYLAPEVTGSVVLQEIDETIGAYKRSEVLPFSSKSDIITQVRKLGGR